LGPFETAASQAPQGEGTERSMAASTLSLKTEGAGNAECTLHPRSRVQSAQRDTHTSIQVQPKHSGIPCANGLTAYAELSLETNSSCLHRCRLDGSFDPVGSISPPTAWHQPRVSGPHGFAVRFSADHLARCARSRITALQTRFAPDAAASTASRPAFVTTRDPPLVSRRDARKKPLIWGGWEGNIFAREAG
jgi:hypothetical protein